jgi:hypothetical protein
MSRMNVNAIVSLVVASVRACANVVVVLRRRLHLHLSTAFGRGSTTLGTQMPECMSDPWSERWTAYPGQLALVRISTQSKRSPIQKRHS